MKISFSVFKKHSTVSTIAAVIIILIAISAARNNDKKSNSDDTGSSKPKAELINVKDYMQGFRTVSASGNVESLEQADLKTLASGKVTKINVSVGQKVTKGQILVTLEQSSQIAALTSAKGALAQAEANYNRVISGASNEDIAVTQAAYDSAKAALESTQKQQDVLVSSAFKSLTNNGLAATASSGNSGDTTLTITGSYTGEELGSYNISVYQSGDGARFLVSGLEKSQGLVSTSPQPLGTRGLYIQFSSFSAPSNNTWTVNIPNPQASGYTTYQNAYQTALETRQSAISAAQNTLAQAEAALNLKKSSARSVDIQAAQAQILTAQGQVQAAQAALENTIIRAPFNGVISSVPVKFADLVTAGSNIVSIVNPGGLQVKIFVSDIDLASLKIGDIAKIGKDQILGTVRNFSPSVSQSSKTAEVDISIDEPAKSGLTSGQNVQVLIAGNNAEVTSENTFLLPIQAVKITPDDKAYVYTLDNNKAKQNQVKFGKVDGENVLVTNGLNADMQILSNAYGVRDGDEVEIQ